ncbi:hypothetical protein GCM10008959_36500 [Deinococcus seoulensis]|uniref:YCII-related domain-containing protein n=1 Tax=Deinococcus seoulensis TaxID=1837379 RepID=A0ABQ2S019_9DEIO|nr:hypothetical protein GCM10008959_36500 [Deinococcus seoulensis]
MTVAIKFDLLGLHTKLPGDKAQHIGGHIEWIEEECAQKPQGRELEGVSEAIMLAFFRSDPRVIAVIQNEIPPELLGTGGALNWPY